MVDRRSFVSGMLAAGALAVLPGCGRISADDPGSADIESARPLALCLIAPASLDPYNACDESSQVLAWQLFDALTAYDFATGELSCLAAERFEMSADARAFTFHLRAATFHNGEPVTAADFKRAWERVIDPASPAATATGVPSVIAGMLSVIEGYAELREGSATELSGVTCPDDATLRIALRTPYADLPYLLAHPALGPVPAAADDDPVAFAAAPIGNGPFQMAGTWKPGDSTIALERFDGYAGDPATLGGVRIEVSDDLEQAYQLFQTGDVDICRCPVREASSAAANLGQRVGEPVMARGNRFVRCAGLATSMLACNLRASALQNADVRHALSLAIDREYLSDTLYRATRLPADGVVPPAMRGYREAAWPYALFDRAQAKELLDARYPVDDEGMRGLSLRLLYNADGGHREIIEAVIENLAAVGVAVEPEDVDIDTMRERVAAGDFDLVRMDWASDAPVMDGMLFPLFFSANDTSTNVSGYRDDGVDELLAQARATGDEGARLALLQEADALIGRDCPVIPLLFQATPYVGSDRVEELLIEPQGRLSLATAQLGE